jgi:hypothetical protein
MSDTATEAAAPDTSATDTDETLPAGAGTPGEAENGSQAETEGGEGDSEARGRSGQYRRRAQEAEARVAEVEAQSTEHVATIERLQRLHVEQAITTAGIKPAAVFAVAALADLLGDDGLPDADKVTAAVATAREQLGIERHATVRQLGMRSGAGAPPPKRDGYVAAFGPRNE